MKNTKPKIKDTSISDKLSTPEPMMTFLFWRLPLSRLTHALSITAPSYFQARSKASKLLECSSLDAMGHKMVKNAPAELMDGQLRSVAALAAVYGIRL